MGRTQTLSILACCAVLGGLGCGTEPATTNAPAPSTAANPPAVPSVTDGQTSTPVPGTQGQPTTTPGGETPVLTPTPGGEEFTQPAAGGGAPPVVPTGGETNSPTTAPTGPVPCNVQNTVQSSCGTCHGETPIGGAIKLTTLADWHQMSPAFDKTRKVYEIAEQRINDGSMPQGSQLSETALSTLNGWLAGGAQAGSAADANCEPVEPTPVSMTPTNGDYGTECDRPGAFDPLVARGSEQCWEFPVHAPGSQGPFSVPTNETYHEFYYNIPWPSGHVATRFGADFDKLEVLHHYLVFSSGALGKSHGHVDQNVLGTTLGTNSKLIAGWAVGGCSQEMPEEAGLEMATSGMVMIQWHMYNSTGGRAMDNSKVQICTVPRSERENVAGITFLGTEFDGVFMGPGDNSFKTRCTNNSGKPVTIVNFTPHMHTIGKHMKADLVSGGQKTTIFDEPFQFDYQIGYSYHDGKRPVVQPGDSIESTCSFFNDTPGLVPFGESTNEEMCYNFMTSYPAGAINNGVLSLIGATNTCWGPLLPL